MKSKNIKKIIVKCAHYWQEEINVDADLFDDVYLEAATQTMDKLKNDPTLKVTPVFECWEKKDAKNINKHYCYNTYFVMINAGMHVKAEILRINFRKVHGTDLQKESIKGENGTDIEPTK